MPPTRGRSISPQRANKKSKRAKTPKSDLNTIFAPGLLKPSNVQRLHASYAQSEPFKYAAVNQLFDDTLLKDVSKEIMDNIYFTEKETDIYKVNQTGDLASLSYLSKEQLALFPSLNILRNALYSATFRDFLRTVTGCDALSGSKQDMSINSYKKGCHLLNHDDVIGTRRVHLLNQNMATRVTSIDSPIVCRRVSYILYLPLPYGQPWKSSYGGALELYPVEESVTGVLEPLTAPSKVIPPSWNQFVFFEVQPGRSFHSVEEVVVEPGPDGTQRLSVSGWFHKPQHGEEGHIPPEDADAGREKSSLEQLSSSSTQLRPYPSEFTPKSFLSTEDTMFLSEYLNPVYLSPKTMKALAARFADESSIELHTFLRKSLSNRLEQCLRDDDRDDQLSRAARTNDGGGRAIIPSHNCGVGGGRGWQAKGPPHKLRYCVLARNRPNSKGPDVQTGQHTLRNLQNNLFPSSAFRAWLALLSSMIPHKYTVEARRFRPGLDYTLARSEQSAARLDVVLGLTPIEVGSVNDWESGRYGGWECYMAPHKGEDDPAVYRSGHSKAIAQGASNDKDDEEQDGEDHDGTLLVAQPGFNRLLIVFRDAGVLSFVKYLSAEAPGCRWDICGEWEVEDRESGSESEE
ncbi:hypothetical protein FRB97_003116 [Tulasnella sp. 331]|nr:hypothetical protein FRB97_003116 [Tulasnella sp. 331]